MVFKILNKLEKSGDLYVLSRAGLLSSKMYMYRDVYMDYDKNIRSGLSKTEALNKTSIEMNVSEIMVYRAKKLMELSPSKK